MKYIKTYEKIKYEEYKKGDFVLLDIEKMKRMDAERHYFVDFYEYPDNMAKIIYFDEEMFYPYRIEFYNGKTTVVSFYDFIRKLTEDEIEHFKTKKSAFKYNL